MKDRIVILGFLSHFPVAGVAWQTVHYLVGFRRLGFDVYYVEAHGCTASKLMESETDDGPARAAAYIDTVLRRFDLSDKWAYHAPYPQPRYFGLSAAQLKELYQSAALIINLHGSHLPKEELIATNRLIYLETDPVDIEIDLFQNRKETYDYLAPHCAFFTYGENLGQPDCLVPNPKQFQFRPTRQPVVLDFWDNPDPAGGTAFTTVGNWRQPWRQVSFKGETYRWSKHFEFQKFIDLPLWVGQPFELALSSYEAEDQKLLEGKGWKVRHALELSSNLDTYRHYIQQSRGEFTVAKDQNIRLRSGWFSDRAATYLAAGRPVITQETGFSNILPTGEGLFAFSSKDDLIAAITTVNADYHHQRRAAKIIAHDYFSHEVVLGRLLSELSMALPHAPRGFAIPGQEALRPNSKATSDLSQEETFKTDAGGQQPASSSAGSTSSLPGALVLAPVGRWPTRLPEETLQTALALPTPLLSAVRPPDSQRNPSTTSAKRNSQVGPRVRASIVIVTHNGLAYTKMCLATLLGPAWKGNDELIIVDNASTDGTPAYLRDLLQKNSRGRRQATPSMTDNSRAREVNYSRIQVHFNSENRGFAAANNQGLARARGEILILLNNDTLVLPGWRDALLRSLTNASIGLVGPVTNRTCNEAQIDAPYRTYAELEQFAADCVSKRHRQTMDVGMLAMFCLAMRRDTFEKVGPLDEQFAVGMFEDDDYARRVKQLGYRVVCREDIFVHHFGQGSFGELCKTGDYDQIFESNRRRFEAKWGEAWRPHGRRITAEYQELRQRIRQTVSNRLPDGATVVIITKGDEDLLKLKPQLGWHFPRGEDGSYPNLYPVDSTEAISQLERLRDKGADYLLVPKPAFWWLDHYNAFRQHLERHYSVAVRDTETCVIFDLGGVCA